MGRLARTLAPPSMVLVGGHVGGVVSLILLVRVAAAAQAELAAGVLPRLPCAIPVEAKLREGLPDGAGRPARV